MHQQGRCGEEVYTCLGPRGYNGRDGRNGRNGRNGIDGRNGITIDPSMVITEFSPTITFTKNNGEPGDLTVSGTNKGFWYDVRDDTSGLFIRTVSMAIDADWSNVSEFGSQDFFINFPVDCVAANPAESFVPVTLFAPTGALGSMGYINISAPQSRIVVNAYEDVFGIYISTLGFLLSVQYRTTSFKLSTTYKFSISGLSPL